MELWAVEVQHLTKTFKYSIAVNDVDLFVT